MLERYGLTGRTIHYLQPRCWESYLDLSHPLKFDSLHDVIGIDSLIKNIVLFSQKGMTSSLWCLMMMNLAFHTIGKLNIFEQDGW